MKCEKCNKEVSEKDQYCRSCGSKIINKKQINIQKPNQPQTESQKSKDKTIGSFGWRGIVALVIFFVARYLGSNELFGNDVDAWITSISWVIISLIIALEIGKAFSQWFFKRHSVKSPIIRVVTWSNLIVWLFPVLGAISGGLTVSFAKYSERKTLYLILGILGLVASSIAFVYGYLHELGFI